MPSSPMASQSFIGRDIFARIWSLVLLSAAAAEIDNLQIPFDPQLRQFTAKHDEDLTMLWKSIQQCTCLRDDLMASAIEDSIWAGTRTLYADPDMLKAELALASLNPEEFKRLGFEGTTFDGESIRQACSDLLAKLFGSLLAAQFGYCYNARTDTETLTDATRALQDVFSKLSSIVESVQLPLNSLSLFEFAFSNWLPVWSWTCAHQSPSEDFQNHVDSWIEYMRTSSP
ncbi:hypothetical protein [Chondromyces crocatus]|uniref:Uncharacterized protein n=1 Tax=Chondromyces crocatus TaxID=52 RepID=A0A0K1ESG2_CHOCO|nr:hypothetical protein [Chondromyces crocatus]AKT43572.1 uncharacterized protein CMC5_078040 [Chondromyces crocatus]